MTSQPSPIVAVVPNERNPSGTLLTAEQVAERWQVSKAHVYRLAREGHVPKVAIGRYYRFRLASIEAWEQDSEAATHA